jgi:F-type H+-transporting ATPase subunit c
MNIELINNIISGTMIAVGIIAPAIAIGRIGSTAMQSIARNPEASSKIQTAMMIAIAFAEALAIYVLVVSLIIKFT